MLYRTDESHPSTISPTLAGTTFIGRGTAPVRAWAFETMDWKSLFTYNEATGELVWKRRLREAFPSDRSFGAWHSNFCGKVAGVKKKTRSGDPESVVVHHLVRDYKAHRIIWEMFNGPIPGGMEIDHRDGDPWNNRLFNLRLATHSQNLRNLKLSKANTSGHKGIRWDRGAWRVVITVNGKGINLGRHNRIEKAIAARKNAEAIYFGEFIRQ